VRRLHEIASGRGQTLAQMAIAWILPTTSDLALIRSAERSATRRLALAHNQESSIHSPRRTAEIYRYAVEGDIDLWKASAGSGVASEKQLDGRLSSVYKSPPSWEGVTPSHCGGQDGSSRTSSGKAAQVFGLQRPSGSMVAFPSAVFVGLRRPFCFTPLVWGVAGKHSLHLAIISRRSILRNSCSSLTLYSVLNPMDPGFLHFLSGAAHLMDSRPLRFTCYYYRGASISRSGDPPAWAR